jgi:hypothetical protein
MKEKRNLHLKVQEMCDCYATGDPLKEMSIIKNDEDRDCSPARRQQQCRRNHHHPFFGRKCARCRRVP